MTGLTEHYIEDAAVVPLPVLDEHEQGLKREIMKTLVQTPIMGLRLRMFKRRGEYTVFVPIGTKFEVDAALQSKRVQCCDMVVAEADSFCTTERLQRVVEQACRETGVALVQGVSRKIHLDLGLKMFAFTVRY